MREPNPREKNQWEIGICGTFDVANYGDLLFPLLAEFELKKRLAVNGSELRLRRFSYHQASPPKWPFEVTSVSSLPEMMGNLDGLLIGGGHLIRFDKLVAPGYFPPHSEIHHPGGYWLTPALMALQHGVPLIFNAPGMHAGGEIPDWAVPLIETLLAGSSYFSVRDRLTCETLATLPGGAAVSVVPDTAFHLPKLLDLEGPPSKQFSQVAAAAGLDRPHIVVQANPASTPFIRMVEAAPDRFSKYQFLLIPIGPGLGEDPSLVPTPLSNVVRLAEWPHPLVIAELIGRAEAVVGHSFHLMISALTAGVPIFTGQDMSSGKYTALKHFETIFPLPPDAASFASRVGRKAPPAAVAETDESLDRHWDRVADALRSPRSGAEEFGRWLQGVPKRIEELTNLAEERQRELDEALATIRSRDVSIARILNSRSWRGTAPVRWLAELVFGK